MNGILHTFAVLLVLILPYSKTQFHGNLNMTHNFSKEKKYASELQLGSAKFSVFLVLQDLEHFGG